MPTTWPGHKNDSLYRADIDGLRAVSILLVVGYHAQFGLISGGFIGVDVFFVISGFLITRIILGQLGAGTFSFPAFYSRRVRRIFPALIVVLAVSYLIGWFVLLPDGFALLGRNTAASVAFVSNLFQLGQAGYFAPNAAENPLLHLWSLGIEEQFYIFWPPLLLLMFGSKRRGFWMAAVAAASFGVSLMIFFGYKEWSFYSPISRAWELLAGGIVADRYIEHPQAPARSFLHRANLLASIGLAAIVGARDWAQHGQPVSRRLRIAAGTWRGADYRLTGFGGEPDFTVEPADGSDRFDQLSALSLALAAIGLSLDHAKRQSKPAWRFGRPSLSRPFCPG